MKMHGLGDGVYWAVQLSWFFNLSLVSPQNPFAVSERPCGGRLLYALICLACAETCRFTPGS
jgi:hypothetical protein